MTKQEIQAAKMALKTKRCEIPFSNLSGTALQLFMQFTEFELKQMAKGAWTKPLVLFPLPKPAPPVVEVKNTIIAKPMVAKDLPKATNVKKKKYKKGKTDD